MTAKITSSTLQSNVSSSTRLETGKKKRRRSKRMKSSISMLEFRELSKIHEFDEALNTSLQSAIGASSSLDKSDDTKLMEPTDIETKNDAEDDEFFFAFDSDEDLSQHDSTKYSNNTASTVSSTMVTLDEQQLTGTDHHDDFSEVSFSSSLSPESPSESWDGTEKMSLKRKDKHPQHGDVNKAMLVVQELDNLLTLSICQNNISVNKECENEVKARQGPSERSNVHDHSTRRDIEGSQKTAHDDKGISCYTLSSSTPSVTTAHRRSIFGRNRSMDSTARCTVSNRDNISNDKTFSMITQSDRSYSFPTETSLKSSLKKTSSYGNFKATGDIRRSTSSSSMKHSVSFSNLSIREYSIELGDHPSCSYGPPVCLSWDYRREKTVPVDVYEKKRELHRPRRSARDLVLSYNVRQYLLTRMGGYTHSDLMQAMNEVDKVKRQRKITGLLMPVRDLDEAMEDITRNVQSMFYRRVL